MKFDFKVPNNSEISGFLEGRHVMPIYNRGFERMQRQESAYNYVGVFEGKHIVGLVCFNKETAMTQFSLKKDYIKYYRHFMTKALAVLDTVEQKFIKCIVPLDLRSVIQTIAGLGFKHRTMILDYGKVKNKPINAILFQKKIREQ